MPPIINYQMDSYIVDFEPLCKSIYKKYQKSDLLGVVQLLSENRILLRKIFKTLLISSIKDITINYDIDIDKNGDKIMSGIKQEADTLVKSSLIIAAIHHMLYNLLATKDNYYLKLDGQTEMQIVDREITYYTYVSSKPELNIYFHGFILQYALESVFNKHFYLGMDFEFTNKKIELAQLNFEHNISDKSFIMIINPDQLEQSMSKDFIELILCSKSIKKIVHGSDAQDIPYIYDKLLDGDDQRIIKFTNSTIDTKLICDYYKVNSPVPTDEKCSIYDAIRYFDVISTEMYDKLNDIVESMQPHQDIRWNIHHLPKAYVLYALYDVIFLKYFYYRMIMVATKSDSNAIEKKATMSLYRHVLFEMTQFIYLEKRYDEKSPETSMIIKCKLESDPINNYMIYFFKGGERKTMKLLDIFNQILPSIRITNPNFSFDTLLKVKYYAKKLTVILKKMAYTVISQNYTINKDKMTKWEVRLSNQYVFDYLDKLKYKYLLRTFKEIESIFNARILQLIPKQVKAKY